MEQLKNKTNDLALSQLSRWRQRIHYENILLLYEYNTIYIHTKIYIQDDIFKHELQYSLRPLQVFAVSCR